ncbi:RNA exonuclease 1 homolog [Salarias fasciatus]|uniref:RNA exonuclease 1 homolog n=1 Tax=Salarias fasciatus TaxID=181472 RepID=UPI001176815D|nr:RNA exonuclease 1 homolog [Salarias fasciatus]
MFPSCGIFGNVSCPVARRGLCERPHCFYKHGASARDEVDGSAGDSEGVQNGNLCAASGTPVSVETQDDGFHELERINKEIETVRQEVEVEQRRLSGCQTAQERSTKHGPSLKYAPYSTKVDGGPSNLYKTAKAKYVVDNSRPRTDLEYDPLSNFSAALRCHNSSAEEQKVKNLKRAIMLRLQIVCGPADLPRTPASNLPHRHEDGVHSHTPEERAQLLVRDIKKMSSEVPRPTRDYVPLTRTSSVIHLGDAGAASHTRQVLSTYSNLTDEVKSSSKPHHPPLKTEDDVIVISSGDEEEHSYSDIELSDCDPMEECYRIFMEANEGDAPNEDNMSSEDESKPAEKVAPLPLAGKKRVAHEASHTEPVAKSRLQPQVLVPFRGPVASGSGSQPPLASKIKQIQQTACVAHTASVNRGQAPLKKPETQSTPPALTPPLKAAAPQNAYLNPLPGRGTVIAIDSNLHLLVPDGAVALPVNPTAVPASILTPIGRAPAGPMPPPAVTSVPGKRKPKHFETAKDKVPHDVRQRYVNMFTEEFLKTTPNVNEAFQKALTEEKVVYSRSMNKVKYQSVAVNALKRLRNQSTVVTTVDNEVKSGRLRGNIPLNLKKLYSNADDVDLYKALKDYILTDERLIENNYPILNPERRGCAVLFSGSKRASTDPLKRICCRCGATYSVNRAGKHVRQEECTYHYGRGVTKRVPGGVETRYSCCEGVMGAPGCQVFKLHVHDFLSLEGFVSTAPSSPSDTSCPGVFSLDCARCYTVNGLELSRVTVVDSSLQVVYDTFVKPSGEVIDYNTRFSGISKEDVKGTSTSFTEVQQTLMSFISADTVLIGHSLETALCLLKLLHNTVVDTSEVFPHRLGPPNKLSLNKLTAEYLRKIIQESACGHDTAEDAAACMELMLWKAKEDGKLKK